MGKTINPQAITFLLGLKPDYAHTAGDSNKCNGKEISNFSEGQWSLISQANPEAPLEDHLQSILDRLKGREAALNQLRQENRAMDIFIGVFADSNTGFEISKKSISIIANLSIDLSFDIYR
jgi:Domain of unknown function (DUF4279)